MILLGKQFYTILELDKEFALNLTDTLERSTLELLLKLDVSISNADIQTSKDILHTIKGGCANYGAEKMTSTSKFIEDKITYLDKSNINDFKQLANQLHQELLQTLDAARNA